MHSLITTLVLSLSCTCAVVSLRHSSSIDSFYYDVAIWSRLAEIYVETSADIKRVILRALEAPVNGMGMDSTELLLLVETCPKGAETLVTRMLHILTDRGTPDDVGWCWLVHHDSCCRAPFPGTGLSRSRFVPEACSRCSLPHPGLEWLGEARSIARFAQTRQTQPPSSKRGLQ